MVRFTRRLTWLAIISLVLLATMLQAAPVFKAGDRVVIYGDSITEQRMYTRFLQQYLTCRYPDLKLAFFNAGWSGDQAGGALNRLDRDVLSLHPNVVTMFFGMNDGGYRPLDQNILANYRKNMEGLITTLQAKNITPVVYTPGCVDPDHRNDKDFNYNQTLEALGAADLELAKQYNCPSADVHHPMLNFQTAQKAAHPGYTMIPDSVHPDANGHLVMTYLMLQGLGAEPMPTLGAFDAATGKATGLRAVSQDATKLVLETTAPMPIPFWFDASNLPAMRDSGFLAMAGQKLTVTGLTADAYLVTADDVKIGRYTREDLAAGVSIPGTYSKAGKLIYDEINQKENLYYLAWRQIKLPFSDLPDTQKAFDSLLAVNDNLQARILTDAAPAKVTLTLTPVAGSDNLALEKTYVCSDPNAFGWGIGKLTDGSWESSADHCFASNSATQFPKTVTIDLEKVSKVATVIAGVPNFGSTKTITVAVSADGKTFSDVGTNEFKQRTEEKFTYAFPAVDARYVRLTYPDHYDEAVNYDANFVFTTEVEVYGPAKNAN